MRRRTQIVLVITVMVAALVSFYSYVHVSQLLRLQILAAHDTSASLTSQLGYLANAAAPDLASTRVNTNDPEAVRRAIAYYLGTDATLNSMLQSVVGSWSTVYDAAIVDSNGKAILHTDPNLIGKLLPDRPDLQTLQDADFRQQLRMVYHPPSIYEVRMPLELNGVPFGSIRLGVSTIFLRSELTPQLRSAVIFSGGAILLSLIFAAGLSRIALGPLEQISRSLDSVTAGGAELIAEQDEAGRDEYGLVTLKIAHLGRQMKDVREIFSALKDNVDQLMANLQDGLMLFTADLRVVLVSASVERFLGRPRRELLGRTAQEAFSSSSSLGAAVLEGFHSHRPITQRELDSSNGRRVQVSLDFIQEGGTPIGALMTLRDAESVQRIGDEIELSRRMSASGRLTRGVAHEVKNPINAIVLHLQLLQNKLQQTDPDTRRHMDIIGNEIHRLDRVVQILVDFTRPRDLRLEEIDLHRLLDEVIVLATPEAEQHRVNLTRVFAPTSLPVKVDPDFIKQAMLNVVLNGIQAMPQGGTLAISTRADGNTAITEIRDEGNGIPPEVQEKIFELYFTTKKGGSGIGLAQTFQILQWHYGSINFDSVDGHGTTFRLSLPRIEMKPEERGRSEGGDGGAQPAVPISPNSAAKVS
jgi:signal transduction histidine kinase